VFSYLPMAHIYERSVDLASIDGGRALGFSQGDHAKLAEDVAELKPTIFPGVPRVWQRMYDRINAQVADSNFISRQLFERGLAAKSDALAHGVKDSTIWDRLVFSKVAGKFGGNLKLLISGAAPISQSIAEFIHIAFQAPMLEGYGLTETCATLTLGSLDSPNMGRSVGIPLPCNEVKLVDVPDMGYLSSDQPQPRGEIWVRGFNVFSGYFKLPEVTAECLTDDGWFQTGDVGMWLPNGSLKIIDRKKNLFKLSQGEYIRPEHIEGVYKQCKSAADAR
jgi:long-chain acyl-CoA synthetase